MASASLSTTLAAFTATIQRTKNRLVAIPAEAQRRLGLERRANNHIIHVSIRPAGRGRWNHHYFKLTGDNEFAIPADVTGFQCGDALDVKVHRVITDEAVQAAEREAPPESGLGLLLELDKQPRPGWRTDSSVRVDEYLRHQIREEMHR
jgi:hypothetical protein